jgi:hypothetical protein
MNDKKGSIRFSNAGVVYPNGAVGMKDLDLEISRASSWSWSARPAPASRPCCVPSTD